MIILFSYATAFFVTLLGCYLFIEPAVRLGLMDKPGGRKQHDGTVPLIGGIAIFFGFCFASLTLPISLSAYRSLFAAGALLVVVGVMDDMVELSPRIRLAVQLFAAFLVAVCGGVVLKQFGNFFTLGNVYLGEWGVVLSIVAIVGLVNAMNMLDGVDGLAGTLGVIQLTLLAYLAWHANRFNDMHVLIVMIFAVFAFLYLNFPFLRSAKIFMGDAGSMFLGLVLTWFCISLSQGPVTAANPVTFVWIMAVPIFDLTLVVIRRLSQGRSPFKADRLHLHHALLAIGMSARQTTLLISGVSLLLGLIGIVLNNFVIRGAISIIAFFILFLMYYFTMLFFQRLLCDVKK